MRILIYNDCGTEKFLNVFFPVASLKPYSRYQMPFWHPIRVIQRQLHAEERAVPMVGTIVYRAFSKYNETSRLIFFLLKLL